MKFFLIDGSSFLYRAYYAFPPMMDQDGHNVNVVYGFSRMLMRIFQEKPDYFVITWDSPVKTLRHEEYPDYKANRKKMDDDFKHQLPITKEIVDQLGIPSLVMPGYEADDIISTLVQRHQSDPNLFISIYSGDKDLKQLLAPNVYCVDSMKDLTTTTDSFIKEFGFEPKHILDYLALVGDSSDNIKGITGIGPKKASDLIQKYQTIENIYAHLDDISGDLRQKLIDGREDVRVSRGLIELKFIPEVHDHDLDKYALSLDFPTFKQILVHRYNFHSFEKIIDELKKKLQTPVQTGLF